MDSARKDKTPSALKSILFAEAKSQLLLKSQKLSRI